MKVNVNIQLSLSDAIVVSAMVERSLNKMYEARGHYQEGEEPVPEFLADAIQEKERILETVEDAVFSIQRNYCASAKDGNQDTVWD